MKTRNPSELVSEFFSSFSESYRELYKERHGAKPQPTEAQLQARILSHFWAFFQRRRPSWEVHELFAKYGPPGKREESRLNRKRLVQLYGRLGKPPKLQFARQAAKFNAALLKRGCHPSELLGTGTTNIQNMHHYVKELLRQQKYREIADMNCRNQERRPHDMSWWYKHL
jgi:hypothetical protein